MSPEEQGAEVATVEFSSTSQRRTVSGRLLVSYLVVLAAFAITLGWSFRALREGVRDATLLRDAYVPLSAAIGEALAGQNVMNAQLNHITSAKNPDDVRRWIMTARRLRPITFEKIRTDAFASLPQEAEPAGLRELVLKEIAALEKVLEDQGKRFGHLFQALGANESSKAEELRNQLVATEGVVAQRLRALRSRVESEMGKRIEAAQRRERQSIQLMIGLSILTLVVGLLASVYTRRVLAPLSTVTERTRAVAEGDLRPRDVVATDDEIGELAATFEDMVGAIRKARAELVQAERLATIGKMAAQITHEVRNPLSSISLNLELLEDELVGAKQQSEAAQLLDAIKSEVDRLSEVAEKYLTAVRQPQLQLVRERVDDLVRECYAFFRPELERAGVRSRLDISEGLSEIDLDEVQFRQALVNLLRNAREALPEGGEIVLQVCERPEGGVLICVEDDGAGVPEEHRASIFDPFYTSKQRGTGLGLVVTRAIIEAHRGTIRCVERESGGTRFEISLPLAG